VTIVKSVLFFQTRMETLQVLIKSEDEEKEEDTGTQQHTHSHTEETPCLELVKSER
jgi:hypothetical protein